MQALFGDVLMTKDGEKSTTELLNGKVVGIYFSAHWCPPCRGFTPQLVTAYTDHLKAKNMEIVFVSSDRDENAFKEYFAEMPWVSLPYSDSKRKAALNKKFKVQGIPSFVILDAAGEVITLDGREAVGNDPTGEDFPWTPKTMAELLDFNVHTKDGLVPLETAAKDKVLALYFSAHWCPPCRGYTPKLAAKYVEMKEAGLPIEVVFVSSDRDEAAFDEYRAEQPWLSLPYAERKRKEELSSKFEVEGIPSLVLLDTDRSVITTNARGAIMGDLKDFPFHPKPVSDLAAGADGINQTPSVVILAEAAGSAAQEAAYAALEEVAVEIKAAAKASGADPEFTFFIAKSSAGPVPQIRKLCGLDTVGLTPHEHPLENKENSGAWGCDGCGKGGNVCKTRHRCTEGCDFDYCEECEAKAKEPKTEVVASMVLLDIPDEGAYYKADGYAVSADGIRKFMADYRAGSLTRSQLG